MGDEDIQSFLAECKESGDKAYGALKSVLTKLDNVDSRAEARRFLDRVETYVITEEPDTDTISTYHFRIHELSLCGQNGNPECFTLLDHVPTINTCSCQNSFHQLTLEISNS